MFLHGGWSHIIGNMLFLWAFGKSLEDAMGHTKFLGFYFACGIIAGIVHVIFNYDSRMPTVGASGAIAGVMGAYLVKFPRANIRTLVFLFVFFITTIDIPGDGGIAARLLVRRADLQRLRLDRAYERDRLRGGLVRSHRRLRQRHDPRQDLMGTRTRYLPRSRDIYW